MDDCGLWPKLKSGSVERGSRRERREEAMAMMVQQNWALGGFIFICNDSTQRECFRRQLFGLPYEYRFAVWAIRPGMPLFLFNTSTHLLHGIFQAASYGGLNIDPSAWPDSRHPGRSRFPSQVRIRRATRHLPIPDFVFAHVVGYYAFNRIRLVLTIPEALGLISLFY